MNMSVNMVVSSEGLVCGISEGLGRDKRWRSGVPLPSRKGLKESKSVS